MKELVEKVVKQSEELTDKQRFYNYREALGAIEDAKSLGEHEELDEYHESISRRIPNGGKACLRCGLAIRPR